MLLLLHLELLNKVLAFRRASFNNTNCLTYMAKSLNTSTCTHMKPCYNSSRHDLARRVLLCGERRNETMKSGRDLRHLEYCDMPCDRATDLSHDFMCVHCIIAHSKFYLQDCHSHCYNVNMSISTA